MAIKKNIYIFAFTVLGLLIGLLVKQIAEIYYIKLLLSDFIGYSFGLSWNELIQFNYVFTVVLMVAGTAGAILKIWSDHKKPLGNVNSKLVMQISSTAFANNGIIPEKYTCTGENVNPPLSFHGILADA